MKSLTEAAPAPGVVSIDDHYREGTVHLISNYWGLDSFLEAPLPDRRLDVAYISTASKPYPEHGEPVRFADAERAWLNQQQETGRIKYTEYCVSGKTPEIIHNDLVGRDVIFMGGGNTQYLMQEIHESGADGVIPRLVLDGMWYLGKSAGAIVAGPDIHPRGFFLRSMAKASLARTAGMALTRVYPLPHIDTPSVMGQTYDGKTGWQHAIEMSRTLPVAYILDNNDRKKHNRGE